MMPLPPMPPMPAVPTSQEVQASGLSAGGSYSSVTVHNVINSSDSSGSSHAEIDTNVNGQVSHQSYDTPAGSPVDIEISTSSTSGTATASVYSRTRVDSNTGGQVVVGSSSSSSSAPPKTPHIRSAISSSTPRSLRAPATFSASVWGSIGTILGSIFSFFR
jgi:hypothetical protein